MKRITFRISAITILLILLFQTLALAASAKINGIRLGDDVTKTRIVIDLDSIPQYAVSVDNSGKKLKLLMFDTDRTSIAVPAVKGEAVKQLVLSVDGKSTLLTIDLADSLAYRTMELENPCRLVLDINKEYEKTKVSSKGDGLTFTDYVRCDKRGLFEAYILDVDPAKYKLDLALGNGSVSAGRQTVSCIARSNNALAAINAGYFALNGELIGCNRINGLTAGTTYFTRAAMGIAANGNVVFDRAVYQAYVGIGKVTLGINGVNTERLENDTIMYNRLFGSTTQTNQFGTEYSVVNGRVAAVSKNGNMAIPKNGMVLSVHGTSEEAFKDVKVGDKVDFWETMGDSYEGIPLVIGAGPLLLTDGKLNVTSSEGEFPSDIAVGRAPRTALGIMNNGHYILAVIDGRQSHSIGATLTETAQLMKQFGATDAFNLDGGGSSEMVIQGKVMNKPSDGSERPVGSAVIITAK